MKIQSPIREEVGELAPTRGAGDVGDSCPYLSCLVVDG